MMITPEQRAVTYKQLESAFQEGKELYGVCTNCHGYINFEGIAKEIRNSSSEELICQPCWDKA